MPIDGQWYNSLGSALQLTSNGNSLKGTYQVTSGDPSTNYSVVGSIDATGGPSAVGWTILWVDANGDTNTLSAYAGVYTPGNQESILTTWLRRSEATEVDNWAATQIGADVFTRTQP